MTKRDRYEQLIFCRADWELADIEIDAFYQAWYCDFDSCGILEACYPNVVWC